MVYNKHFMIKFCHKVLALGIENTEEATNLMSFQTQLGQKKAGLCNSGMQSKVMSFSTWMEESWIV